MKQYNRAGQVVKTSVQLGKFPGRVLTVGRLLITRGDGAQWWRYGLWYYGPGTPVSGTPTVLAGERREFSIEYSGGFR